MADVPDGHPSRRVDINLLTVYFIFTAFIQANGFLLCRCEITSRRRI